MIAAVTLLALALVACAVGGAFLGMQLAARIEDVAYEHDQRLEAVERVTIGEDRFQKLVSMIEKEKQRLTTHITKG